MLPTLRQLQYLKLLAEHGSFSRAAEAAHVTQPTLSAGIHELERALGAPVVDRARSGVILTAVGEEAVRRASDILARTEDMVQAAKSAGQALTGRFRLGVIPTIAPFLLPKALPLLRERFPRLKLFLREDLTHRLIEALKAGALDAALIALPYDISGLDYAPVSEDELLAMAPAGHPMTAQASAPLSMLQDGLILLEDGHCLRDQALEVCSRVDVREAEDFRATSLETLRQMVVAGLGITLLPETAVESPFGSQRGLTIRQFAKPAPSRSVGAVWRKSTTRGAAIAAVCDVLAGVMAGGR